MSGIFLTSCTNFFLIRWIANILGFIMNLFYIVIDKFGIGKISICIIVFTIIVKLVMLPINIKQQKTMKLNSVIMPEIQAIQKKYANKKDNDSMMKQQAELNAVYQKYGTSPTGGCLPMLIQFPILLALYAVMACLPNYINEIQDMYNNGVVSYVIGTDESGKLDYHTIHELKDLAGLNDVLLDESGDENLDKLVTAYFGQKGNYEDEEIKDAVYNSFTSAYSNVFGKQDAWAIVEASFDEAIENAQDLKAISEADWKKVEDKDLAEYADYTDEDWDALISSYETILDKLDDNHKDIQVSYSFFTIDLSKSPANGGGVRPVIIIQNDTGNKHSPTVICAAITSRMNKAKLPTHVELDSTKCDIVKDSVILLEQLRTIDKKRLKDKVCHVDREIIEKVDKALLISLELST